MAQQFKQGYRMHRILSNLNRLDVDRLSPTFEVTAYRTLWFGLQYDSEAVDHGETVGNGGLATVRWHDGEPVGDGHLKGQFRALKDVVGEMVDKGVFTPVDGSPVPQAEAR